MSSDPKFSDNNYQTQLDRKSQVFRQKLADANLPVPTIDVYPSAPTGFRMRAEFRIWHEKGKAHYAMNHPGEKKPYIIEDFPIGSILINTLMPPILSAINGLSLIHI